MASVGGTKRENVLLDALPHRLVSIKSFIKDCAVLVFNCYCYIPRKIWQLNLRYNPVVVFTSALVTRVLHDVGYKASDTTTCDRRRWLEEGEFNNQHIAIASYPRSGNSLLRHLLEVLEGVYTGCDTRPDRTLSQQLLAGGMKGEGVVDDSVLFVKTHYPERHGWKPFKAQKAILVVRNPWDAIDSYFNMTLTNSHSTSLSDCQYDRFADRFDLFIKNEIQVWMKFHRYWTRSSQPIPIMVVRYEDLLVHRVETMRRVTMFVHDLKTVVGTPYEKALADLGTNATKTAAATSRPYKPRSGKIAGSFKRFSDEQFQHILKTAKLQLKGFGYDPEEQGFPNVIELPKRQVKQAAAAPAVTRSSHEEEEKRVPGVVVNGNNFQIRKPNDPFGRSSSAFRKGLTEPVVAADGTKLNMHEVLLARKKQERRCKDD